MQKKKQCIEENKDLVYNALQHWIKICNKRNNKIEASNDYNQLLNLKSSLKSQDSDDFERNIQSEAEIKLSNPMSISFGDCQQFSFRSDCKSNYSADEQRSTRTKERFQNLTEEEVAIEFERVKREREQLLQNKNKLLEIKQKEENDLKRKEEEDQRRIFNMQHQIKSELLQKADYLKSQITLYNMKVSEFSKIENNYTMTGDDKLLIDAKTLFEQIKTMKPWIPQILNDLNNLNQEIAKFN